MLECLASVKIEGVSQTVIYGEYLLYHDYNRVCTIIKPGVGRGFNSHVITCLGPWCVLKSKQKLCIKLQNTCKIQILLMNKRDSALQTLHRAKYYPVMLACISLISNSFV